MRMSLEDGLLLAESLSAYLCHEIAGPLGTVAASIELGDEGEALMAARAAILRLRFLRAAWSGQAGALDGPGLATLATGLPGADRCQVDATHVTVLLPEDLARLALCLLPACVLGLPRGGVIHIAGVSRRVVLEIIGRDAAWPPGLANTGAVFGEARGLPVALALLLARQLEHTITFSSQTELVIEAPPTRASEAMASGAALRG